VRELVIAALGPALVLFISEAFRWFHAKKEREERFFYEVYPKRLELYEEIIKETDYIGDEELPSGCASAGELSDFYKGKCDTLIALGYRCGLYGSPRVVATLASLVEILAGGVNIAESLQGPLDNEFKLNLIGMINPGATAMKLKLIEFIGEESGQYVADKKILKLLKEFKARANKAKKKQNNHRDRGANSYGGPYRY
jgi:hypothetical protein